MTTSLHDLTRHLAQVPPELREERLAAIERCLADGADPNATDAEGCTALGLVAQNRQEDTWYGQVARILLRHGANPLIADIALVQARVPVLDEIVANEMSLATQGEWRRSAQGENPLHLLATHNPQSFAAMIEEHVLFSPGRLNGPGDPATGHVLNCWLSQTREIDGATPLHCLWNDTSHLHVLRTRGQDSFDEMQAAWFSLALAKASGVDMGTVDHHGKSIARIFMDALDAGAPEPDELLMIIGPLRAICAHEQLTDATPSVEPRRVRRV